MDGHSTPDYPVVMSNLLVFFVAASWVQWFSAKGVHFQG